jgi:chromosome partitioning protein
MPVVAVVNRKGGSGKTTLATHLAAWFANGGHAAMLGDVDFQGSAQSWLKRRSGQDAVRGKPIVGWSADPRNVLRPPAGVTHVVLDTPGGLRGLDLAKVVMTADAVLVPVCHSVFDRDSAADCYAELKALPRVASGRCKVAAVGMRLDARTRGEDVLRQWADSIGLPFIGVIRETQGYVRCVEQGLSLFDMPPAKVQSDLDQWTPIFEWLAPVLKPVATTGAAVPVQRVTPAPVAAPVSAPAPAPAVRPLPVSRPAAAVQIPIDVLEGPPRREGLAARLGSWLGIAPLRRLRQRNL